MPLTNNFSTSLIQINSDSVLSSIRYKIPCSYVLVSDGYILTPLGYILVSDGYNQDINMLVSCGYILATKALSWFLMIISWLLNFCF